ncbi:hypothetical protein K2F54_10625 [Cryobacterium sp. 1639]|uniref:hypothetical protein n=1 Tax=Cryobacterium inferilacus TaxID=2866629 RepID=UPI001C7329BF|nr:hypothetical protein [Cryobacterium sp. 1639]MBX0300430.1 hypothetical protein [Cryobacterium sp. 1639]
MGIFSRNSASQEPAAVSSDAAAPDQPLVDPDLNADDPRQLVFGLLKGAGLTFTLSCPGTVDGLLREALRASPTLGRSRHLGRGFFALNDDPATIWVATEGPGGSAVLVFGSPESDSALLFKAITQPFEACRSPFASGFVFSGTTKPRLKAVIEGGDVVPIWEVHEFSSLAPTGGYITLPAQVRRTVRSWERLTVDLYRREFTDHDGDAVSVHVALLDGQPKLLVNMASLPDSSIRTIERLLEGTQYTLEQWEDMTVVTRVLPAGTDATDLADLAQTFVDDLTAVLAAVTSAQAPELPATSGALTVWQHFDHPGSGSVVARTFDWPARAIEYTMTERVRESGSGEGSRFSTLNRLAARLRERRGAGFEYAWRASGDVTLSPSWLTLRSAKIDVESGRIVAAGHLTHEVWGLPPAYDLGAIDGRNMSSFPDDGHTDGLLWPPQTLYIGTVASGTMMPVDATINVISVDLHGPSGSIACLEHLGSSTGAITIYDQGENRRVVTVIEGLAGNEPIRFSNDGEWLLVSRSRDSVLVHASTGRWVTLDVANADWWPLDGSSLLTIEHADGTGTPRVFSLAGNEYMQSFPAINLDVPAIPEYPYFWHPTVSPNAREVLVQTPAGVSPAYQQKNGAGNHLARVTLATGRGVLEHRVYFDDYQTLECDVSEARWVQRPPHAPLELHPVFVARLEEAITTHPHLDPGRWADEAERILIRSLNMMITLAQQGEDIHHLLPEVLASLVAVAHDSDVIERQREWLVGLQRTTSTMIANGSTSGRSATAWRRFGEAIAAVQAGRPDLIVPLSATWA